MSHMVALVQTPQMPVVGTGTCIQKYRILKLFREVTQPVTTVRGAEGIVDVNVAKFSQGCAERIDILLFRFDLRDVIIHTAQL